MAESYDTLKDLPRVPHAEGTAMTAIQTGVGGNPPDKKYISYGEAVDIAVAASRLRARQKGEMEKIAGGIDDEDERLYTKHVASGPFSKMKVAQKHALTPDEVAKLKSAPVMQSGAEVKVGPISSGPPAGGAAETKDPGSLVLSYPGAPGQPRGDVRREGLLPSMGGPAGTVPPFEPHGPDEFSGPHGGSQLKGPKWDPGPPELKPAAQPSAQPQVVYVEKPVEKIVQVPVETNITKWLKQRTRIQIATEQMSFNISAVTAIRSIHAITIILPTSNDAMTFIPNIGAKVKVQPSGGDVLETIFTGASFDIPELGIMGLAFLIPNS